MNSGDRVYRCGTIVYTKAGLVALFGWLLWGDFCFTLMEAVVPSILPIKLRLLDAPNWVIGAIITAAPGVLNMTVCPWVSFKSDRCRSRWGRRIPFILFTLPFLCLFLALLGFSEDISRFLQSHFAGLRLFAPATVTIVLIGVFMLFFQFFNMFVNSVFWYLFNDVVPPQFLGQFMGSFRIVGVGAGALYNYLIFKYAESHAREILVGAALLYFVGFAAMCLMVKEGKYPPVEEPAQRHGGLTGLKTFFAETFSHKFYIYRFLATSFTSVAIAIGIFNIFFNQEMGLNYDQIGKVTAINAAAVMVATFFAAVFIDRWHPLRICTYAAVFGVINSAWVWIFVSLPGEYFFWISVGEGVVSAFLAALVGVAGLPCEMRTFPQSRFGQFCSSQAMIRSIFTVAAGVLAGIFIDVIRSIFADRGPGFAYRFISLWVIAFSAVAAYFLVQAYRGWNALGGDRHFHPPAPWAPSGIEEMPITPTIGPQRKWLGLAIRLFDGVMMLPVIGIPLMAYWMFAKGQTAAGHWYLWVILPLGLAALGCWLRVRYRLKQDMAAAIAGKKPDNGIPHHGILILIGGQYLLMLGVWGFEVWVTISLRMQTGSIVFALAKVLANFLLVAGIWLICRIERGYSTNIDVSPAPAAASAVEAAGPCRTTPSLH